MNVTYDKALNLVRNKIKYLRRCVSIGNFDINKVTDALAKVSSQRSRVGAETNALEHAYAQNQNTVENVVSSKSEIADLDMHKAISEQKKNELLNTFQMMMQKQKQDNEVKNNMQFFANI